jgi:hypothetical protein
MELDLKRKIGESGEFDDSDKKGKGEEWGMDRGLGKVRLKAKLRGRVVVSCE